MDEMKQAFDSVAEDGVVQPHLLQRVLQRRNPQATEADAMTLIEMMRPNEDEDASFSGFVSGVMALSLDLGIFAVATTTPQDGSPQPLDIRLGDISIFDDASDHADSASVDLVSVDSASVDFNGGGELNAGSAVSGSPGGGGFQRDASTPAPTMDAMKQAFDSVAEDGVVVPGLLLVVLQRRNPQATEADALSLIEMMRPNEDEDASFSGFVAGVAALSLDMRIFLDGESAGGHAISSRASDSTLSAVSQNATPNS
jgi:hypothetical protein